MFVYGVAGVLSCCGFFIDVFVSLEFCFWDGCLFKHDGEVYPTGILVKPLSYSISIGCGWE